VSGAHARRKRCNWSDLRSEDKAEDRLLALLTLLNATVAAYRDHLQSAVETLRAECQLGNHRQALTLTLFDPGYAHFCNHQPFALRRVGPPYPCARRTRTWLSVAERGRVIVLCKDWPSATAYGGCGLDKGLSPGPLFATKRSMAQTVRAPTVGPLI
jgi:hypothetical protein